jgi:hypothetical protein
MKAYGGSRRVAPLSDNFGIRWVWLVNFMDQPLYPRERMPVPIEEGAVWAPESVWTFWKREHFSPLPEFESRTVQPVASQYIKYANPAPLSDYTAYIKLFYVFLVS